MTMYTLEEVRALEGLLFSVRLARQYKRRFTLSADELPRIETILEKVLSTIA